VPRINLGDKDVVVVTLFSMFLNRVAQAILFGLAQRSGAVDVMHGDDGVEVFLLEYVGFLQATAMRAGGLGIG